MKLRYLGPILGALALAVTLPACGDDSGSSTEPEPEPADTDTGDSDTAEPEPEPDDDAGEPEPEPDDSDTAEPEPTPEPDDDAGEPEPTPEPDDSDTAEPEPTPEPDDDAGEPEPEPEPESVDCPDLEDREIKEITGAISADTEWTCDTEYVLGDIIFVTDNSMLTIGPGTNVYGATNSALVITAGSIIEAEGTAEQPIVMSSANAEGARATGDWGGLVLLGEAPINGEGGTASIEGIDPTIGSGEYGGSDEKHYCGTLKYVRVEFAGYEIAPDNELNGISVGGCGSDTVLDYVQVHRGKDDGIEFWGGAAQVSHIVISAAADDSIDWDSGFQGKMQFLAIQQDEAQSDNGFESDNNADSVDAMPRSMPTIYNVTSIGGGGNGMVLRVGTWGRIYNTILMNYGTAIDVRDEASALGTEEDPPALTVENSIFFNNGEDGETHFADESAEEDDDDASFDEEAFFSAEARNNRFDVDPELGDPADLSGPDFMPADDSPCAEGAADPTDEDDDFFVEADYVGAFEPGGKDWTEGWTSYPED